MKQEVIKIRLWKDIKINDTQARVIKEKKKEGTLITAIRNAKKASYFDTTDIRMMIRGYCESFYANNVENLVDKFQMAADQNGWERGRSEFPTPIGEIRSII